MPQFDKSIQTFYKYHPRNYNHSQHPNFLFKNYHIFGDFQFQESENSHCQYYNPSTTSAKFKILFPFLFAYRIAWYAPPEE